MVLLREEKPKNDLLVRVCEEMSIAFYELHLFSETRFISYANRTYTFFSLMWPVINQYFEECSAEDSVSAVEAQTRKDFHPET